MSIIIRFLRGRRVPSSRRVLVIVPAECPAILLWAPWRARRFLGGNVGVIGPLGLLGEAMLAVLGLWPVLGHPGAS